MIKKSLIIVLVATKRRISRIFATGFFFLFPVIAFAQSVIYEAESASLSKVTIQNDGTGFSGTGYVAFRSNDSTYKVTFTVTAPATRNYNMAVGYRSSYGYKEQYVYVNNQYAGIMAFPQVNDFTEISWENSVSLHQGSNTITIKAFWGWFDLDYIKISGISPVGEILVQPGTIVAHKNAIFKAINASDPDGAIESFVWDFGDGQTASGDSASHIYSTPGLFRVTLTMTDNDNNSTKKQILVKVYSGLPVAIIRTPILTPEPGTSVFFKGSDSYDTGGTLTFFHWDFGDGTGSDSINVHHIYYQAGCYRVTLRVTDDDNQQVSRSVLLYVYPAGTKIMGPVLLTSSPGTFRKCEFAFQTGTSYFNVYDPDVVQADGLIIPPGGNDTVLIPAFYREYMFMDDEGWKRDSSLFSWMVRFSPTVTGNYKLIIKLKDQAGTWQSDPFDFTVQQTNDQGFIYPDANNHQYYRRSTGEPFLPVGENVAWSNDWTSFDAKINNYYNQITAIAQNGGNLIRYWMVPFGSQALEWKNGYSFYKGIGHYSQEAAAMLDSIFSLCGNLGVNIQLTLFQHGMYSENVNPNWSDNPYNIANGGFLEHAADFFWNTNARKLTRNLLRYTIARWGYATNLFSWELFNEVDLTGNTSNNPSSWVTNVDVWHEEMGTFIKNSDPYRHPISTSVSGWMDHPLVAALGNNTFLDVMQFHSYGDDVPGSILQRYAIQKTKTNLPVLCGEFGKTNLTENGDEVRSSYWVGLLNNLPVWHWDWDKAYNNNWYQYFKPLTSFFASFDPAITGYPKPVTPLIRSSYTSLKSAALQSDSIFFGYIYDPSSSSLHQQVTLETDSLPFGYFKVSFVDPATGTEKVTDSVPVINYFTELRLPPFGKDIAVKCRWMHPYLKPLAILGRDIKTALGKMVVLDGSASFDPLGLPLTYSWQVLKSPVGSQVDISAETENKVQFIPDVSGKYQIALSVQTSENNKSLPDTMDIVVSAPPHAIITEDTIQASIGKLLTLRGGQSSDPDNDQLSFSWKIISMPQGSRAVLYYPNDSSSMIRPDKEGFYVIVLQVSDGICDPVTDTVIVKAILGTNIPATPTGLFTIYPNPSNGRFRLEGISEFQGKLLIRLLNLQGKCLQVLYNETAPRGVNTIDLQINNRLAAGVYFVEISSAEGIWMKKIQIIGK
ncbi:MAG: PKD domain-containing protein [Bacteroidales bacterium]